VEHPVFMFSYIRSALYNLSLIATLALTYAMCAQNNSVVGIPVLAYHRFDAAVPASTTVTIATFESQLAVLSARHYTIVPLSRVVDVVLRKAPLPAEPIVAITVDDGHRSVYTVLYPIIKQRRIPVTLFIYPSAISNSEYALTWAQLREMKASGLVDIQSHTYWHPNFRKEKAHRTPAGYTAFVDAQLIRSRDKLDSQVGTHVDLLAWPYGIFDTGLNTAAQHAGYRAAFGYAAGIARPGDDPFSIHRIPVADSARGPAFDALLHYAQTHPERSQVNAGRE
jgi:peptidoglycan/xylan/chitin deacetylase (PgdA/CDA1 family)